MKLYTAQLGRWREAKKRDIPFINTTVKSGDKTFAPTWDFLMKYKDDQDEEAYIEKFIPLMRKSYQDNRQVWDDLVDMEVVCLACYCKAGKFCHRKLLVDILQKICLYRGIEFEYLGEL